MNSVFIGGVPAAGKSFLADKISKKYGINHVEVDKIRGAIDKLELTQWVNYFRDQDPEEYWQKTKSKEHCQNVIKQTEMLWPEMLNSIKTILEKGETTIFESRNFLPHLVKDLSIPGIFILPESIDILRVRNKIRPRWIKEGIDLQESLLEAFMCESKIIAEEAREHGYKAFSNSLDAERELLNLLQIN